MRHLAIPALGVFVAFSAGSVVSADPSGRNEVRALERVSSKDSASSSARALADESGRTIRQIDTSQARVRELGNSGSGNGPTQGNGSPAGNRSQMGSRNGNRGNNGPGAGTCDTPGSRSTMGSRGRSKK